MAKTSTPTRDVEFEVDPAVQARIDAADAAPKSGKKSAKQALKAEAGKLGSEAGDKIKTLAGDGKIAATDALSELAKLLDKAAGDVDAKLGAQFGGYARSASGAVQRFSDDVRGREIDDILGNVTDFVKKSPGIAIGTAAALGFVVARVLQSGIDAGRDKD